nr:MAG TPA: hypothetical protein [Caudoviricetes sp.]
MSSVVISFAFTNPRLAVKIGCSDVKVVVRNEPHGLIVYVGSLNFSYICIFLISTNYPSLFISLSSNVTSSTFTKPLYVQTFSPGVRHPAIYNPYGGSFTGYSHITTEP